MTPKELDKLRDILIYVDAARRAYPISVARLILRDEIEPRLKELLKGEAK